MHALDDSKSGSQLRSLIKACNIPIRSHTTLVVIPEKKKIFKTQFSGNSDNRATLAQSITGAVVQGTGKRTTNVLAGEAGFTQTVKERP
jgi:hypothetical protein